MIKQRNRATHAVDWERRQLLTWSMLAGFGVPLLARAQSPVDEFKAFQQQHLQSFDRYQQALLDAFAEYKQLHTAAYADYRKRLSTHWDDPAMTDQKKWVEYNETFDEQRTVDYERNEIRLTKRMPAGQQRSDEQIRTELKQLLAEDELTANQRDPVTQAVEKGLANTVDVPVATPTPAPAKPVLSELFDQPKPTPKQVKTKADELLETAKHETVNVKRDDPAGGWADRVTIALPTDRPVRKAQEYRSTVTKRARETNIGYDLIFAIMHTESSFNPRAQSNIPAYGLMQIVPRSAGMDASQAIFGKARVLSPSYLYDADNNIHVGATYLKILYYRYLRAVQDTESRMYCAIAAYNTGAGNVAKTFTNGTSVSKAANVINRLKPEQVYEQLTNKLPYEETRRYLPKVVKRIAAYRDV